MMATDYTPNFNLDLYASMDKPNLRDQYNAAMGKVDAQMKKTADDVTNANANVLAMQTQVSKNKEDIAALESTVETHGVQITGVQKTADDALSLAQTNETGISGTQADVAELTGGVSKNKADIASLSARVSTAEGSITEAQSDIGRLQSTVDQKAPTNHASPANTYGQGSSTNFGHVKVVDSGNAGASTGTAASPKMVTDLLTLTAKSARFTMDNANLSWSIIKTATNADKSIFKIYGICNVIVTGKPAYMTTAEPILNRGDEYDIIAVGFAFSHATAGYYASLDITRLSDGRLKLKLPVGNGTYNIQLTTSLYIDANLGDTPRE